MFLGCIAGKPVKYYIHFLSFRPTATESLKRRKRLLSSLDEEEDRKFPCLVSLDPLDHLPSQVFVQVLLDSQLDLSTTAWVLVRVSRRWKEAIEYHLCKRWRAVDVYRPFLWSSGPSLSGGLIPPMVSLLKEWGRQGWLGLLQWAHGLGFPLLYRDGRHTLLAAACLGGHQPVVAWVLDDLGGHLAKGKAIKGACRSGNDALLRWLIEERHVNPTYDIPMDENPASRGNLEMCQWLAKQCRSNDWLTGAGRNDHRHILEWAISERRGVNYMVWPQGCYVWLTAPVHVSGPGCGVGRARGYPGVAMGATAKQSRITLCWHRIQMGNPGEQASSCEMADR